MYNTPDVQHLTDEPFSAATRMASSGSKPSCLFRTPSLTMDRLGSCFKPYIDTLIGQATYISCLRSPVSIISSRKWQCEFLHPDSKLCSSLYLRNDPYETSDAVFGVKDSLVVDVHKVDEYQAARYGVNEGASLIKYDFVLAGEEDTRKLREKNALEATKKLGLHMKLWNSLPIPNVD